VLFGVWCHLTAEGVPESDAAVSFAGEGWLRFLGDPEVLGVFSASRLRGADEGRQSTAWLGKSFALDPSSGSPHPPEGAVLALK
jgi:hypothetical protein